MKNKIELNDTIFIAGASGMVGSAIKKTLFKYGYGNHSKGGEILAPARRELDLTKSNEVEAFFLSKKPSIVILAAAKVGGIYINSKQPADFLLENLKIQTNIIEAAWKSGVKRFLFLGSSCIYPKNSPQPINETSLLTSELEKTNECYAIAKISGLKLCQSLRTQYGFDAISLMPTNLYGAGDNYNPRDSHVLPGLMSKFFYAKKNNEKFVRCWGSGKPLREFLFVDDLADACIFCLRNWSPQFLENSKSSDKDINWINVGSEDEISIKSLAKKIALLVNFKGSILWDDSKPDGTLRKKLDNSKINNLGWKAKTSLDEGLEKTFYDFKEKLKNKILRI